MLWLLDDRRLELLYMMQVHSSLEYACLTWGATGRKHLILLDKVQDCTARLIKDSSAGPVSHLHPLQQRRDITGLTALFEVQLKHASHLQEPRQPHCWAQVTIQGVILAPSELLQPRCWTWHHQSQFINTYVSW
ncbi:hypothetical protein E2C01_046367 [Portunus trituberculatus]|uniref:Uncharacterized protein n=1 Tax=Portunus trituberculatus TaxID=210409 RepID=A0A5B7G4P3_PORTR|nr:hypothetical protein [Portunus trituberculatus]